MPAARWGGCLLSVEAPSDGGGSKPSGRVQLEDAPDDRRGSLVGDQLLLIVACISERDAPVRPAAFPGAALDPTRHAIDDRRVLELGEDPEHLKHHPPRRRACVERLGGRAQNHVELCQLLGDARELADLATEPVDPVDEQLIDPALAGEVECGLQPRAIELRAGGAVFVGAMIRQPSCTLQKASRRSCWEASEVGWFSSSVEIRV